MQTPMIHQAHDQAVVAKWDALVEHLSKDALNVLAQQNRDRQGYYQSVNQSLYAQPGPLFGPSLH